MNLEERLKKQAETKARNDAYFASIAHLKDYFNLKRVKPFKLNAYLTAKVDALLSKHNIPTEPRTDLHWIFGYVSIQYTIEFDKDKKRWEEERQLYTKSSTKDGIDLYYNMNRLPCWEAIESITFKVKPGYSYGGTPEKTLTISYPEMIRFIEEAIREKRDSREEVVNKSHFFAEELEKLEKYTDNDEWYKGEVEMNRMLDPKWRDQENKKLKKYRRTKKSLSNFQVQRKKDTIEELYYYLTNHINFSSQIALCRFMADLLYTAGMPFVQEEKYMAESESHEVKLMEIAEQIKTAIIALKA